MLVSCLICVTLSHSTKVLVGNARNGARRKLLSVTAEL
jgi:hypothetical protein